MVAGDDAQFYELGVRQKVERHEIGTRFFDRRILLAQESMRRLRHARRHPARAVADDFVHGRRELLREASPFLRAVGLFPAPREFDPHRLGRRALVRIAHVGERDRLAAVLFADRLIVGQIDTNRGQRPRVARFDDDLDCACRDAGDVRLAETRLPRHAILEPLCVGGECLNVARLRLVDVTDDSFPRALDAARVHVDLDEAVDGVNGRLLVAHPRDVVGDSIGILARFVELDQRAEGFAHRRRRKRTTRRADDRQSAGSRGRSGRQSGRPPRPAGRCPPSGGNSGRTVR